MSSNKLLSDIVAFRTYARYLEHLGRRETLKETIDRTMNMHLDRFPLLVDDIKGAFDSVHNLKVMPSMRAMQFSGPPIIKNEVRQYNCSFVNVDDVKVFGECLFLLLSGVGVGFSVQNRHISKLPKVKLPKQNGFFVVQDSIYGWAQALELLTDSYFFGKVKPRFDFGDISAEGTYLPTIGAKAPGPKPLQRMLEQVEEKLKVAAGRKLTDIECHDIICIISDCVLSGGIRRAALISLFDANSKAMLESKHGEWWNHAPYRARANNSAVLHRGTTTREEYDYVFDMCQKSGSGEPGIYWSSNLDMGSNPCCEIALNSTQFCNLTTINQTGILNKDDFMKRVHDATLIGTLQASYTSFDYLRPSWQEVTEREALLGVSFTGIADNAGVITPELLREGAKYALEVNEKYAKLLGINKAARVTTVKPEGSSSCVLSSSSGIHARHADYYIRRVRMNKNDSLAGYLTKTIPGLVEDDLFSSTGVVVSIPQKSPEGAITRHQETAFTLLDRTLMYRKNWIEHGHRTGDNHHNVSVTISVKDSEWSELKERMWMHQNDYSGISLLPFDGGTYQQAPFEDCTKEVYEQMSEQVKNIDLSQVNEKTDNTARTETIACSGGSCEII